MYVYENSTMKPTKTVKKKQNSGGGGEGKEGNRGGKFE
jgi:hypothetical protein